MDVEPEEKVLTFFLVYENRENILQLSEYDTVELLKIHIHQIFDVPPSKQILAGWKNTPKSDNTILQMCVESDTVICLVIKGAEDHFPQPETSCSSGVDTDEGLEIEASISFTEKISRQGLDSSLVFHTCTIQDAIIETCLTPLEKRKVLLLILYNEHDTFSSVFYKNLSKPDVIEILNRSFFLLGWDVSNSKYQNALINALNRCSELSNLINLVNTKVAAALTIVPVDKCLTICSCARGNISDVDFMQTLIQAENFLIYENEQEQELNQLNERTESENDMGSINYQKLMCDMLGDRDYDSFEFDEHEHFKKKIAFALMGPPQKQEGYDTKDLKKVDFLYDTILNNSNKIAKYKDKVEISFIYNCTEPLPPEKLSRAKRYEDYNPNTDVLPVPIFVIRKCRGSENPCRIFIDDTGRTYDTWQEYINRNKLHECEMFLPRDGRYEVDRNGEVLLEKHLSPACGVDSKLLQGADYVSTAGGLVSGGIFVAAAIPAISVAPALLIAGTAVGLGTGIYAIGRSIYTLYDRSRHNESLSFSNSEARGAYLNIVAGSLGFVGAGANMAVSQLAVRGVNVGKGARAVVNTISFANIGASGVSVLNSGYDVFDQWLNENQTPSWLTIVQLSSSILFFGHAVYNFRMASTIIEETQARTLQDYQDSLRSNRHRKTFSKLLKETVRQNGGNEIQGRAEVISAIRNFQNKDEVFATLTRSNREMNRRGIRFAAVDGEIRLNGINIDMNEFTGMNKKETITFLSNLQRTDPTPIETTSMRRVVSDCLPNFSVPDLETFVNYAVRVFGWCNSDIKSKIISILSAVLYKLTNSVVQVLDEIFPNRSKYFYLLDMMAQYFEKEAGNFEDQYKKWMETGDDQYYNPLFRYMDGDKIKRYKKFFENAVNVCYKGMNITEEAIKSLLTYFYNWLAKQIFDYQERMERNTRRRVHSATSPTQKIACNICGGYYYKLQ